MEVLTGLIVGAELIVGGTLFRVLEDLVGLADFFEARLGVLLLAHIGMIFSRQLAVGAFDFILRCVAFQAHDFVIIFKFHR